MMWSTALSLAGLLLAGTSYAQETFSNPVIYSDFPDNDIFTGPDGAYYFSASNFHFSPGAPILKSTDLINWDIVGHSIPRLTVGDGYDLPASGETAYRGGTWASSMRYRESDGQWYWIGCINFYFTWVFTAPAPEGPWSLRGNLGGGNCYYDNGLLVDDDDSLYVVYGPNDIRIAQLGADGLSTVRTESVFSNNTAGVESLEGNRLYKINGTYYVLNDLPGGTTFIWKSDSVWGPYEHKILVENATPPLEGGSSPHQGSLVQTPSGDWYFMSFTWAYPSGRLPVLAPVTWGDDGFPSLVKGANGGWGETYPLPAEATGQTKNWTRTDTFEASELHPSWEWNHNPDVNSYSVGDGLTLRTASVTNDIYHARNTLTHRTHGPHPVGTVELEFGDMAVGDRAGLAAFRDRTAYIGIHRSASGFALSAMHDMTVDEWSGQPVAGSGFEAATGEVPEGATKVWLRLDLDTSPTGTRAAKLLYSWDGEEYAQLGPEYELYDGWAFFIAYRFGIFNFATEALGGSVRVASFTAA